MLDTDQRRETAAPPTGPVDTELSAAGGDVSTTLPVEIDADNDEDPFGFCTTLDHDEDAHLEWPDAGPVVQAPAQSHGASVEVAQDAPQSAGMPTDVGTSTDVLSESQLAVIARNRADALQRRRNSVSQTPPPPTPVSAEISRRSRSPHGRGGNGLPEPAEPLLPAPAMAVVQVRSAITEPVRAFNALTYSRDCQAT